MKDSATHFIEKLDAGQLAVTDAYNSVKAMDPLLAYFVLRFLKEKYGRDAGSGGAKTLMELLSTYPDVAKLTRVSEDEPMKEWFDDSYSMRQYFGKPSEFIELIVDKLEG